MYYLTYLKSLPASCKYVSTAMIAQALRLGEIQVRKDIAQIARVGHSRTGRVTAELIHDIECSIGLGHSMRAIFVGNGDILPWLLDQCGETVRIEVKSDELHWADALLNPAFGDIRLGILNVSPETLTLIASTMEKSGIRYIWNFSKAPLSGVKNVRVLNSNLLPSLGVLSYLTSAESAEK